MDVLTNLQKSSFESLKSISAFWDAQCPELFATEEESEQSRTNAAKQLAAHLSKTENFESAFKKLEQDEKHVEEVNQKGAAALSEGARHILVQPETAEWGRTLTPQIMAELKAFWRGDMERRTKTDRTAIKKAESRRAYGQGFMIAGAVIAALSTAVALSAFALAWAAVAIGLVVGLALAIVLPGELIKMQPTILQDSGTFLS